MSKKGPLLTPSLRKECPAHPAVHQCYLLTFHRPGPSFARSSLTAARCQPQAGDFCHQIVSARVRPDVHLPLLSHTHAAYLSTSFQNKAAKRPVTNNRNTESAPKGLNTTGPGTTGTPPPFPRRSGGAFPGSRLPPALPRRGAGGAVARPPWHLPAPCPEPSPPPVASLRPAFPRASHGRAGRPGEGGSHRRRGGLCGGAARSLWGRGAVVTPLPPPSLLPSLSLRAAAGGERCGDSGRNGRRAAVWAGRRLGRAAGSGPLRSGPLRSCPLRSCRRPLGPASQPRYLRSPSFGR